MMYYMTLFTVSIKDLIINIVEDHNIILCCFIFVILSSFYFFNQSRKVYLVDFACSKPRQEIACQWSHDMLTERSKLMDNVSEENLTFIKKVLQRSGIGQKTYVPLVLNFPFDPKLADAKKETEMVMFGAIDELIMKTCVEPKDIAILVTNCSAFNPAPSLSSLVINKFQMRENIMSYNLAGMGCSGSTTAIDLAKNLLKVHQDSYALVVSTENISSNWYKGNNRSMLLTNCLFRMGGAAILLSNRKSDHYHSKYQLVHSVRTTLSANDKSYECVFQQEDDKRNVGFFLSKEMMVVAGDCLKTNIIALSPLVLPLMEKIKYAANLVARKLLKIKTIKPYVPNFKSGLEHILVHAGGRAVLDAVEKSLNLTSWDMEPSRMTLNRFGNTSSSSLWYELAYSEAKGRVQRGDRIWQISFGSGYKCNSIVWRALRNVDPEKTGNPWTDEIHEFPIGVPRFTY